MRLPPLFRALRKMDGSVEIHWRMRGSRSRMFTVVCFSTYYSCTLAIVKIVLRKKSLLPISFHGIAF